MVMAKAVFKMDGDIRLSPIHVQSWDETNGLHPGLTLTFGFS
jgi:hypothetical protein